MPDNPGKENKIEKFNLVIEGKPREAVKLRPRLGSKGINLGDFYSRFEAERKKREESDGLLKTQGFAKFRYDV